MAGVRFHVNSGEVALVAATAKSVLQVKAASNHRCLIRGLRLMGKAAAGGTDTPIKVRATRSSANFGTFTSATGYKSDPNDDETLQTTCGSNATVEPTTPTDAGLWWELPPQLGIVEFLPFDQPIVVPGGQSIQFEATSSGTPTVMFEADCEE